ncbi:hypothetical protein BC829DRAFT_449378 [Chytridium lagenaria]|nr:hypothetical protein BC829DRAFT_449378 [Chytridium lagenaria]
MSCIYLNGTTACPQWAQSIQPLQISSLVTYLPFLSPQGSPSLTTGVQAFDSLILSLPLTTLWGRRMGCPLIATPPTDTTSYPLRFAESFTCGSVVSNAVKGGVCVDSEKVGKLPSLCRETCTAFLESLERTLRECGNPSATERKEREVYLGMVGSVCEGLRSVSEPIPVGSSKCVESFGNSTAGITSARTYCASNPSQSCCSYLSSDAATANRIVGNIYGSGARTVQDNPPLIISTVLIGGLLFVTLASFLSYRFYRRRNDDDAASRAAKSGFGSAGSLGIDGTKGLVLGARSRLSFVRKVEIPDHPLAPLPGGSTQRKPAPQRNPSMRDPNQNSLSKRLGPTAAGDVGGGGRMYPPDAKKRGENPFDDPFSTVERRAAPVRKESANGQQGQGWAGK